MHAYQQRVVDEKTALNDKIVKLNLFIAGSQFRALSSAERERLARQLTHMNGYATALDERIEAFNTGLTSG